MLFRANPLPICKLLPARFAQNIPRKSLARRRVLITYSGSSVICRWFFSVLFRANLLPICKLLAAASPQGKVRGTLYECKVLASKPAAPFPHKSCSLEPAEKYFGRHPRCAALRGPRCKTSLENLLPGGAFSSLMTDHPSFVVGSFRRFFAQISCRYVNIANSGYLTRLFLRI